MTKRIIWRLKTPPSPEEVRELVKDKIITQEEAREILFSQESEEERIFESEVSLRAEIGFLRKLVEKLASRTKIIETIREVQVPYTRYQWYPVYQTWCETNLPATTSDYWTCSVTNTGSVTNTSMSFSDIKTF